ncbi:sensor histidine kinase [Terrihabitans sp. B22-R8]|uniref:sensor histidine kinase n=1 Tax=Terrihabitans sp. B22-R8 TaxID=3425128 RepID=UPI00403CA565
MPNSARALQNLDPQSEIAELRALVAAHDEELRQRDLLMREVNHRVANSLQLASSMLRMQAHQEADQHTRDALEKAGLRLSSIQHVHGRLYRSGDMRTIEFSQYLRELSSELSASMLHEREEPVFTIEVDCERMRLPTDHVSKLGLVVNEFVTNAFKHAQRAGEPCLICICARKEDEQRLVLEVSDTGEGLPEDFDMARVRGLGMRLVRFVAGSLGGDAGARNREGQPGAVFWVNISVAPPPPPAHDEPGN